MESPFDLYISISWKVAHDRQKVLIIKKKNIFFIDCLQACFKYYMSIVPKGHDDRGEERMDIGTAVKR
jgi:hypothetical protein